MATHESGVNYENLIRDLADMYPFEVAEVVLVELVANCLDAGATCISIEFDPNTYVLVVTDNGKGMTSSDFDQYHDFAAGLKTRGTGIGFAGVGAKISFNIATRVLTETQSESFCGGSHWYLQSKKRLLWDDIEAAQLHGYGTRVEVHFRRDATISYTSTEDLIKLLRRHYLPLMDSQFLALYEGLHYYSSSLRFRVNGQVVEPGELIADFNLANVREFFPKKAGRRIGRGILGVTPLEYPLGADICGVLLCTRGKVIKSDLFNQFPSSLGPRIFGVVEIPDFVNFLTSNKADFIRRGKYREFEKLYDPIRQEFRGWLEELGIRPIEVAGSDEAAKLERELKKLLDDVPELVELFDGPRSRKKVLQPSGTGSISAGEHDGVEMTFPDGTGNRGEGPGPVGPGDQPGKTLIEDEESGTTPARPISRIGPRGPKISFVEAPNRVEMAWVDGNSVVINSSHPCYAKTRSNATARTFHSIFAIGNAIQRFLASEGDTENLVFTDRMMAAWGSK